MRNKVKESRGGGEEERIIYLASSLRWTEKDGALDKNRGFQRYGCERRWVGETLGMIDNELSCAIRILKWEEGHKLSLP